MRLAGLISLSLMSVTLAAEELPTAAPEDVGMSSERLQRITAFTQKRIDAGQHAGYVTMLARHGKIVHFEAIGTLGVDNEKPMQKDTLFRIYSMTKPVTAVAMMMLYEEGAFQMDEPVSKYLPQLADLKLYEDGAWSEDTYNPTIEQLFTHTAGFTYGWRPDVTVDTLYQEADIWNSPNLDVFIDKLAGLPLRFEPGTRYHYSVSYDILGALVEKLSGMTLDRFFKTRIFMPLGMEDSFFAVPEEKMSRLATNHRWDAAEQHLVPMPADQPRASMPERLLSGGGGLVSTAMDYMKFCEMLRRGGTFNGARLLGPKTVAYMRMNHLTEEVRNRGASEYPESHLYKGQYFGLGFGIMLKPGISEVISSVGEYSWGGTADTKFWIDPQEDLVAILMTQVMSPPWPTRYEMKIATYQSLTELGAD